MNSPHPNNRIDPLILDSVGHKENLLGNEAIVRGALESGVGFACGYPGTPSSEVTDSFARIAEPCGIHFEYSINEKIALEMAFAASLTGTRSICAMKHLGLMYAGDPLSTIPYIGVVGGMVIVSAGDPSCRTSPNEQDQRYLSDMLFLPMLDPATPQEAYQMTLFAFELSEQSSLPVVMRITTHVCHSRATIEYGKLRKPEFKSFQRNPQRFVPLPANAVKMRLEINNRVDKARQMVLASDFYNRLGDGPLHILATGAPSAICNDLINDKNLVDQVTLLSTGIVYPLPEERLLGFLSESDQVLIVEELSSYLEDAVLALCSRHGLQTKILGKHTGHLPGQFEYDTAIIDQAIGKCLGIEPSKEPVLEFIPVTPRPPSLCSGCPHRSTYFAARTVFGDEHLYFNDIGCYTLGYGAPLHTVDSLLCMGAAFTLAAGVSRTTGERTIGFLGDSTFFHSGMPALLNAIKENANMIAVIMDNQVTAMTGFQESPTVQIVKDNPTRDIAIEDVVRALGAKQVETVDPHDLTATVMSFERAKKATGVSVIIAKHPCPVYLTREIGKPLYDRTYQIDQTACQTCGREGENLRCSQETKPTFEHHMARGRALEISKNEACAPVAPCTIECPMSICIQGYIGEIASRNYKEAFEMIMECCPLPETICRVCHRPCETVCVRADMDEAVGINDLKRFAVDWANREQIPYQPDCKSPKGKKVAVVGAGPSGLTAAHDLQIRGYETTLFDSEPEPGGLLFTGIPQYRLPREALKRDVDRILGLGVSFEGGKTLFEDYALEDLFSGGFDAVFLGIGARNGVRLNLPAEDDAKELPEIVDALEYLKQVNLNEKAETGRNVLVIGGGNAAIDAARTAQRSGAEKVSIVYRRRREEMPADPEEIEAAEKEGVELQTQYHPVSLTQNPKKGLECLKTEPGPSDESGRSRPVPVDNSETLFEADQIILAIGQNLDEKVFDQKLKFDFTADGLLKVDPNSCQTSNPRVFAGGDAADGNRTVSDAIAWGRLAAWGIDCQISGMEQAGKMPKKPGVDLWNQTGYPPLKRADKDFRKIPSELEPAQRTTNFLEVRNTLNEAEARQEASRCLICGLCGNCRTCIEVLGCPAFYIDQNQIKVDETLCNGCGICAVICPNGAIKEVRNER